jgi:hypothetical protein
MHAHWRLERANLDRHVPATAIGCACGCTYLARATSTILRTRSAKLTTSPKSKQTCSTVIYHILRREPLRLSVASQPHAFCGISCAISQLSDHERFLAPRHRCCSDSWTPAPEIRSAPILRNAVVGGLNHWFTILFSNRLRRASVKLDTGPTQACCLVEEVIASALILARIPTPLLNPCGTRPVGWRVSQTWTFTMSEVAPRGANHKRGYFGEKRRGGPKPPRERGPWFAARWEPTCMSTCADSWVCFGSGDGVRHGLGANPANPFDPPSSSKAAGRS